MLTKGINEIITGAGQIPHSLPSFLLKKYSFIWLCQVLVAAHRIFFFFFSYGMWDLVPQPGLNPSSLHWEHGVLATGPQGSPSHILEKENHVPF